MTMGSTKDRMMKKEDCKQIAEEICVRAGVLARCELCGGIYDSLAGDLVPAYKLGNYLITENNRLVDALNGDRDLLQEVIKELSANAPRECECRQRMQSDD